MYRLPTASSASPTGLKAANGPLLNEYNSAMLLLAIKLAPDTDVEPRIVELDNSETVDELPLSAPDDDDSAGNGVDVEEMNG